MPGSLFQMVRQVLADTKTKLAQEQSGYAAPETAPSAPQPISSELEKRAHLLQNTEKIAHALGVLADNLHHIVDDRSPQEKLAEYAAIQEALRKHAEANHDSISPMSPPMDSGITPGGANSAMKATANTATGTSPEPGSQGQATSEKIPPTHITPTEHAYPADAGNALETNLHDQPGAGGKPIDKIAQVRAQHLAQMVARGDLRKEAAAFIIARDRALVKQAFESQIDPRVEDKMRVMGARAGGTLGALGGGLAGGLGGLAATAGHGPLARIVGGLGGGLVGGGLGLIGGVVPGHVAGQQLGSAIDAFHGRQKPQAPPAMAAPGEGVVDDTKTAAQQAAIVKAVEDAKRRGVPEKLAQAYFKFAGFGGEGENAHIDAGSTPELQHVPEANPAQMQGSEAGQQVPDQKGSDGGRQLIASNDAAINATKNQAKGGMVRSEMDRYIDEPAMSSAHDKTLQQSLDNTSSAGVKIAATRELLQRYASQSPEHRQKLAMAMAKVKKANDAAGYGSPPGAEVPPGESAQPPVNPGASNPGGASMPPPGADPMAMGAMGDPSAGMPGGEGAPGGGGGEAGVPDAALAAAAEGVTPEELAMAEAMLAQQMGGAGMPGGGEAAAMPPGPEAGAPPGGAPQAA